MKEERLWFKVLRVEQTRSISGALIEEFLPTYGLPGFRWIPGKWMVHRGNLVMCERGLHVTCNPGYWLDLYSQRQYAVFRAEVDWKAGWKAAFPDLPEEQVRDPNIRMGMEGKIVCQRVKLDRIPLFTGTALQIRRMLERIGM